MKNEIDIKNILKQFAFSDTEASIYLATLSLGKAKVSDIAKKAQLNRTAAYSNIKDLLSRGVINQITIEKTLHFTATPPEALAEKFQRNTDQFKTIVPHLEALNIIDSETPIVEVTESRSGYQKIYEQISNLPANETFRVIEGKKAYENELSLLADEQLNNFFSKLIEKKIQTKAIFTEDSLLVPASRLTQENLRLNRQRLWQMSSLPKEQLPLDNLALIYENRVSFLFPGNALVLTIRHQGLVDIMIAMFDALFLFARKESK